LAVSLAGVQNGNDGAEILLELRDVSKAFGNVVVADAVSFRLAPGETLGVVGPNGAGKTSMLNLIAGSLAVDRGAITLDGVDVTGLAAHARARLGIGRTHQIPRPFGAMTVFENVLLGATYAGQRRSRGDPNEMSVDALRRTGLLARANSAAGALPLLDRKRLELARALATEPRLLLLDEIAAGLTEPEVEQVVDSVRQIRAESVTIIWIEHLVGALLSVVDRLIAMSVGRVLADGEPRTVMAKPEVRAVYLGQEVP
jgi:branched-chain amino acid transport system ATP-binding protein